MNRIPSKQEIDKLDECFAVIIKDRDRVAAFYDVRHVLASYLEVCSGLGAATIKNGIYTKEEVAQLFAHMMADALTRDVKTVCQLTHGEDLIQGSKQ
jgi:hypothetical protein